MADVLTCCLTLLVALSTTLYTASYTHLRNRRHFNNVTLYTLVILYLHKNNTSTINFNAFHYNFKDYLQNPPTQTFYAHSNYLFTPTLNTQRNIKIKYTRNALVDG